jgi:xylulokinase
MNILTIDVGTSALKAVLYTATGQMLASAVAGYSYQTPQPGWAEANPADWCSALEQALARLRQAGVDLQTVQLMGLTGQMHTAVLLDAQGRPLAPTILWLDRRAVAETAELAHQLKLPPQQLNSTYTLPKLLWLARHQPDILAQTRTLLWPKDYLRYRLTGQRLTDATEAAGAALYDYNRNTWATERLALVNLSPAVLPELRPAAEMAGPVLPQVAARLGLSPATQVLVGAGDVMALLGGAPPASGRLAYSLGSSGMISCLLTPDQIINDPRQRLYIYPLLPYRLLNGVVSTSGAALTWAWQALYDEGAALSSVLDAAYATLPGAEGLLFLPFLTGERSPYWNDALRAGFYGLTLAHNRAHMLRAVLEGVAYSLCQLLEIAQELGVPIAQIALAGGGATITGWPQLIADVCRRPVLLYAGQETVTRALYAYAVTALDPSISFDQALQATFEPPQCLTPRSELADVYEPIFRRYCLLANFATEKLNEVISNQ